ncbi:acetoin utilization protein AcuC, partial [Butyricicoccus sp. 1XD8-22]
GGYDIWRVVPRAWSYIWTEMNDLATPTGPLPKEWLNKWQGKSPVPFIPTWEDPNPLYEPIPRKTEIEEKNEQMLKKALHIIRNEKNKAR